jgi:hypothetical protein
MNKHADVLMLSLIALLMAVMGLARLQKAWPRLLALTVGLLIGYVDLHNNEAWAALILFLPVSFIFGLLAPQRAWQWALLIGVGLPLAYMVALLADTALPCHPGFECPTVNTITTLQTFMALTPAFVGAYSGAFLRWSLVHFKPGQHFNRQEKSNG